MEKKQNMDFSTRGNNTPLPQQNTATPNPVQPINHKRSSSRKQLDFLKWSTLGLGGVLILLLVALILVLTFSAPKSQANYVYNNKLQAVFLNTGQVYFGNIKEINSQYLVLTNIFYLQTNNKSGSSSSTNSSSNSNVSLVKLGCELHAPYDQMVINMQQVTFWENLQSKGQVAKAVAQYYKEYPNGQTCTNQTTGAASSSSGTSTTPPANTTKSSPTASKP